MVRPQNQGLDHGDLGRYIDCLAENWNVFYCSPGSGRTGDRPRTGGHVSEDSTTTSTAGGDDVLRAPLTLEYPFRRTTGPVIGAFLTGLREGRVIGIKDTQGNVIVPPVEYDPATGAPLTELVPVASEGEVVNWSWNDSVRDGQPFDRPFAWALVRLDGADTPILHALDAPHDAISNGLRVKIRFAEERIGSLADIEAFEPVS